MKEYGFCLKDYKAIKLNEVLKIQDILSGNFIVHSNIAKVLNC